MFKVKIDTSGAEKKLSKVINNDMQSLIYDAAIYLTEKIRQDIISGQYVGVITGQLRGGTLVEQGAQEVRVISEMEYTKYVLAYTKNKYGNDYVDIANNIYGGNMIAIVIQEAKKMYNDNYRYENPFP